MALAPHESPCRIDATKAPHQHRCSWQHRDIVDGYRSWVASYEAAAEAATNGYDTEMQQYRRNNPPPTFRAYLTGMTDRGV